MNNPEFKKERRSQRDYNLGFKLAVISQVEKGELTYKQAQKKRVHTASHYWKKCVQLLVSRKFNN